ncbi:hypothetical protein [Actinoallomurus soli]|uniref:hypothetical protein n=1 Tax=Actinoallomurus soli TaxID=2952535 RepID=UPI0020931272|nr:hypothetical protein [Actinoallomurus soli]MCO5971888.1 hypothetical protein [Actinoallomurus soli]
MLDLAIHPLSLVVDAGGARMLAEMPGSALHTRSRGPYTPDNLPPEAVETVKWVALRWSCHPDPPEFTVEGGGRWPRLSALFTARGVLVTFVVPEDASEMYAPEPGQAGVEFHIRLALEQLAKSLRAASRELGGEPPVALSLSYSADPDYEAKAAHVPEPWKRAIPEVMPTINVDRSQWSRKQRAAHDKALRATGYTDQRVDPLRHTGFAVHVISSCLRDLDA